LPARGEWGRGERCLGMERMADFEDRTVWAKKYLDDMLTREPLWKTMGLPEPTLHDLMAACSRAGMWPYWEDDDGGETA
jgi:hypothetical protein